MNFSVVKTFVISLLIQSSFGIIVQTEHGPVEGIIKTTETGRTYYNFQGVPYARPPDGPLRFRDPLPPIKWTEPRNCTVQGPPAWGFNELTGAVQGSFDSLHINVFSHDINPDTLYPVMVYIPGGAYHSGSGSSEVHGPDYLVEKNITLVTMNHRLGPFGFLSLDDPSLNVPGNAGFKDQRLALKWVQKNIANFGGDPNRVTLFGFSAGASSTHFHMMSPSSKGLLHRGIIMGGNVLQNGVGYIPRLQWAQRLAERMGFNSTNETAILEFLENADPVDLVIEQHNILPPESELAGLGFAFGPTQEPYETEGTFLIDDLLPMVQNAWGNEIEFMLGQTSNEVLGVAITLRFAPEFLPAFVDFQNYIPRQLEVERDTEKSLKYAEMIKRTYYGILEPTITNIDGMMFALGDNDLWFPTHRTVQYRLEANSAPTYVYRFDADNDVNFNKSTLPAGVDLYRYPMHGDDLMHLFKSINHKPLNEISQEGYNTIRLMVDAWTNFASFGNPSLPELNIEWPSVTPAKHLLMGLNIKEVDSEVMIFPQAYRIPVFQEIWEMERGNETMTWV